MIPALGLGALAYAVFLPAPAGLWIALALIGMACLTVGGILAVWRVSSHVFRRTAERPGPVSDAANTTEFPPI